MGHYYAEMDPIGYQREQERIQRENDLRLKFNEVALSELMVKDLNPLLRLNGFDIHKRAGESDLFYLENRFAQIQEKRHPKPRQTYDQPESTWLSLYGPDGLDEELVPNQQQTLNSTSFNDELPPDDSWSTRHGE